MQTLLSYLNDSLLFRNFLEVITGLDNTLLLLVISRKKWANIIHF